MDVLWRMHSQKMKITCVSLYIFKTKKGKKNPTTFATHSDNHARAISPKSPCKSLIQISCDNHLSSPYTPDSCEPQPQYQSQELGIWHLWNKLVVWAGNRPRLTPSGRHVADEGQAAQGWWKQTPACLHPHTEPPIHKRLQKGDQLTNTNCTTATRARRDANPHTTG